MRRHAGRRESPYGNGRDNRQFLHGFVSPLKPRAIRAQSARIVPVLLNLEKNAAMNFGSQNRRIEFVRHIRQ
jgi:hypothetical protein